MRHGETIWQQENRYAGSSDVPLSERGHQQAQALGQWAKDAQITNLAVSPLLRARQTMLPIEEALGLQAIVDDRLREIHFGQGEGLTLQQMSKQFPKAFAKFQQNPFAHGLPGGEDPQAVLIRGREALLDLADGVEGRALIVTHNTLIRLVLCDWLGVAPSRYRELFPTLDNGSWTEVEVQQNRMALLHFNVPLY